MAVIEVEYASRYWRRKAANAVGRDLLKALTEPITNADDSYKRLIGRGLLDDTKQMPITIRVDKSARQVQVIDLGEGLTDESMGKLFGRYGEDTSGGSTGSGVRGLFGQGISDVLFCHDNGMVQSIVGKKLYTCKFMKTSDKRKIDIKRSLTNVNSGMRKRLGIPEGNGTVVSFRLIQETPIPQKLADKLRDFYMLRLINSDPARTITLEENTKSRSTSKVIQYDFPGGNTIESWVESFDYEGYPIQAKIELKESIDPLSGNQNGLLVFDEERAVYDQTLFGYDLSHPAAGSLYGTVELIGARLLIHDKMNHQQPREILTDERNGFNKNDDFYIRLRDLIGPKLDALLAPASTTTTSDGDDKTNPKHQKALALFDDLYKNTMGEENLVVFPGPNSDPPTGGLQFDRDHITITAQKAYVIGLNINLDMIPLEETLESTSNRPEVEVKPEAFEITESLQQGSGSLARKSITIRGNKSGVTACISVSAGPPYVANLSVTVVDEYRVYPASLEFYPSSTSVTKGGKRKVHLYINTSSVVPGSTVYVDSDSPHIILERDTLEVPRHLEYDNVAKCDIVFSVEEKCSANITALALDVGEQASVGINVIDARERKPTKPTSKFKDWTFHPNLGSWQCFYDSIPTSPNYCMLLVNSTHPLNQRYFGTNPSKSSVEQSLVAQVYLAEILTNEILNFIFTEKQRSEQKEGGNPTAERDPHNYIRNEIALMKQTIGVEAQKMWVDQKRLSRDIQG